MRDDWRRSTYLKDESYRPLRTLTVNPNMIRRLSMLILTAGAAPVALGGSATAGGLLFHGHGRGHGQQSVLLVQPVQTHAVQVLPAAANVHHLNLAPTTQLQLGTGATLQTGQLQAASLTAPALTTYYVVQGAANPAASPGRNALTVNPGAGDVTDNDYNVLSANLGNSPTRVRGLERIIAAEVEKLFGQGGLGPNQIETLAFDAAETFLSGFVPEPIIKALEPIIDKFIKKAVQDRQARRGTPAPPDASPVPGDVANITGGAVVPAPGGTFTVTGQITFTPVSGRTSPAADSNVRPPPPSNVLKPDEEGLDAPPALPAPTSP